MSASWQRFAIFCAVTSEGSSNPGCLPRLTYNPAIQITRAVPRWEDSSQRALGVSGKFIAPGLLHWSEVAGNCGVLIEMAGGIQSHDDRIDSIQAKRVPEQLRWPQGCAVSISDCFHRDDSDSPRARQRQHLFFISAPVRLRGWEDCQHGVGIEPRDAFNEKAGAGMPSDPE